MTRGGRKHQLFGPRRVNDSFGKLLKSPGGRIVNTKRFVPNFASSMSDGVH
jgi:hypothetical protein